MRICDIVIDSPHFDPRGPFDAVMSQSDHEQRGLLRQMRAAVKPQRIIVMSYMVANMYDSTTDALRVLVDQAEMPSSRVGNWMHAKNAVYEFYQQEQALAVRRLQFERDSPVSLLRDRVLDFNVSPREQTHYKKKKPKAQFVS